MCVAQRREEECKRAVLRRWEQRHMVGGFRGWKQGWTELRQMNKHMRYWVRGAVAHGFDWWKLHVLEHRDKLGRVGAVLEWYRTRELRVSWGGWMDGMREHLQLRQSAAFWHTGAQGQGFDVWARLCSNKHEAMTQLGASMQRWEMRELVGSFRGWVKELAVVRGLENGLRGEVGHGKACG